MRDDGGAQCAGVVSDLVCGVGLTAVLGGLVWTREVMSGLVTGVLACEVMGCGLRSSSLVHAGCIC